MALSITASLLVGCTVGPSSRPDLVTYGAAAPAPTTSTTARSMPIGPGGPGQSSAPLVWGGCPSSATGDDPAGGSNFSLECATLQVPLSYSKPSGPSLSLEVTRARAEGTPANAPALVTMIGSPGENGTDRAAAVAAGLPAEITAHFAVVVLDLRGTGQSQPLNCLSPDNADELMSLGPDPTTSVAGETLSTLSKNVTFDCEDQTGADLTQYSTIPATDDLDTLRAALGTGQLTFLGRGYGATLGSIYADRYPGRVAAMVLDGPADPLLPSDKSATASALASEKALNTFASTCATFTGGCPLGSNPRATITTLIGHLGDVGMSGDEGNLVTGGSVVLALMLLLGSPDQWQKLATALADAQQGNVDPLADALNTAVGGDDRQNELVGQLAYACNDSSVRLVGTALTAAVHSLRASAPIFGPFALQLVGLCGAWPVPAAPLGPVTATGARPILVLGSVNDPISAYSSVQSLAGQLASAVLLSWQSGTHGSYPTSSCMTSAVDAYLLKATVPAAGLLCPP